LRTLAARHGINPKTVAKWKKRGSVADLPTGPKQPKSTVPARVLPAGLLSGKEVPLPSEGRGHRFESCWVRQ